MTNNNFELRRELRREHLLERADKARAIVSGVAAQENEMARYVPPGQPILVGHHSEKRHRRYLTKMDGLARKQAEGVEMAQELERRAKAVGKGGISSDDPEAIEKLQAQLADLEHDQTAMKAVNKAIKKVVSDDDRERVLNTMLTAEQRERLLRLHRGVFYGFPSYETTNNGSNIRRIRGRIHELEASHQQANIEIEGRAYRYCEDPDENRVMIEFMSKPDADIRDLIKQFGFRWSPTGQVWMRQLNTSARASGRALCDRLDATAETDRGDNS